MPAAATPKKTAAKKTAAKKTAPKKTAPKKTAAKKTAAKSRTRAPESPVTVLSSWVAGRSRAMSEVVHALADPSDTVDQWLEDDADLAALLSDDHVWELLAEEEYGVPIPPHRWLVLARHQPGRFAWAIDPERVLPLNSHAQAIQLRGLLLPALTGGPLSVGLSWLRRPGLLDDSEAASILEQKLHSAEDSAGWEAIALALGALAERGAGWRAARHLERLLDRSWLDPSEAALVHKTAAGFVDGPLLSALGRHEPWRSDEKRLYALADAIGTLDLVDAFTGPRASARLSGTTAEKQRVQAVAWRSLARRKDAVARTATARLLLRLKATDQAGLGVALVGLLQDTHGVAVLGDLVTVFLSGHHHHPWGEAIERWLLGHPEQALTTALEPLPDWAPGFDEGAMERLTYRLLPRLSSEGRERIRDLAELCEGPPRRTVLGELGHLG